MWGINYQPNIPPQNMGPKLFTKQQYPNKSNAKSVNCGNNSIVGFSFNN